MIRNFGLSQDMGPTLFKIMDATQADQPEPEVDFMSMTPQQREIWRKIVQDEYARQGLDEMEAFGVKMAARNALVEAVRVRQVTLDELDGILAGCRTHQGRLQMMQELRRREQVLEDQHVDRLRNSKGPKLKGFGNVAAALVAEEKDLTLPERVLAHTSTVNPEIWKHLEGVKADPSRVGAKPWDAVCYMPFGPTQAVMEFIHREKVSKAEAHLALGSDSRLVAALCAWRMTKGVYRFDPTLLSELVRSEIDGDVPTSALLRLPDWCVYIPTPGMEYSAGMPMHGLFAWIDVDSKSTAAPPTLCLEVLLDPTRIAAGILVGMGGGSRWRLERAKDRWREQDEPFMSPEKAAELHFGGDEFLHISMRVDLALGSMKEAVRKTVYSKYEKALELRDWLASKASRAVEPMQRETVQQYVQTVLNMSDAAREASAEGVSRFFMKAVNLVLYLCSEEADITGEERGTRRSEVNAALADDKRVFAAGQVKRWDVGLRIGADIRSWMNDEDRRDSVQESGLGESPRPHVRRAHWHTFLVGPKDKPRQRRPKWLPPIPVNVKSPDDLVPTVHPVS